MRQHKLIIRKTLMYTFNPMGFHSIDIKYLDLPPYPLVRIYHYIK